MSAPECLLCGDFESEHDPVIFGLPRRCRVSRADEMGIYERCGCPGLELNDDEQETADA
jgi:hypothetical protein